MSWILLLCAIATEVGATLSIRASDGFRRRAWIPVTLIGYGAAFVLLSLALADGMPLGIAYGVWTALGVIGTAVLSWAIFREPLTRMMMLGFLLIGAGVLLLELGSV